MAAIYGAFVYGNGFYGDSDSDMPYVDLMSYLPEYYRNSNTVVALQKAFGYSAGELAVSFPDLINQCFVSSATWGLELLEKIYGLKTDQTKSSDLRREIITAKMRGAGTTTTMMIQNVAESFSNGEVTIVEYNDESLFEVKFTGTFGIPPNMDGLTSAIEEIKPAHLAYSYVFIFNTNQRLSAFTHADLSVYTHGQLKNEVRI